MPTNLSANQEQLLTFLPDDGSAIGGYALMAQLQEAGWRTQEIEHVMEELRALGELIIGRGGYGGSIRHVRNDREALLAAVDEFDAEGTPCTRVLLQQYMEWHPDYLEQVLDALLASARITIGDGRRGVIARVEPIDGDPELPRPPPTAVTDPAEDEQHLLELLPETGNIGNTRLRNALVDRHGWDDERYWETRKRLRQRGVVEVGRGRGGSLRRVRMDSVARTGAPPVEPEPRPAEQRDEETLWKHLPESGDDVDLSALQSRVDWNAARFYAALEQMVADQKIHWHNSKVKRLLAVVTGPEPPRPPVSVDVQAAPRSRHEALYVFVCAHFEGKSLQRFLSYHLDAERVTQDISWNMPYNDVVQDVCGELQRSGYIDAEFFQRLRIYFTRLHPEIDALERFWPRPESRG